MVTATLTPAGLAVAEQPFEAAVLGGPVWRVTLTDAALAVRDDGLAAIVAEAERGGVALIACRIAEDDAPAADALASAGFRRVETLVTHERDIGPAPAMPAGVRAADGADADRCADIAAQAFRFDRFHADPRIDAAAADALKAAWTRNNLAGRADANLVAVHGDGAFGGFVSCLVGDDIAVIDLIAVAPSLQRQGIGRRLVSGALAHYGGRARRMRVGTQAVNAASLDLYRACRFAVAARASTYHWTPRKTAAAP